MADFSEKKELKPWEIEENIPGEDYAEESCDGDNSGDTINDSEDIESVASHTIVMNPIDDSVVNCELDVQEQTTPKRINVNRPMTEEESFEREKEIVARAEHTKNPLKKMAIKRIKKDQEDIDSIRDSEPDFKLERSYAKLEYNEKGLIKRTGYAHKISYGPEFEKDNMDRVYKFIVVFASSMLLIFIAGIFLAVYFVMNKM